ncbi:MAG: hypothetical protein AABO58_18275 [Acidobacteriota bacterium]
MTNEERDDFEEHYFDCAVCAEDVKAAIAIRDGSLAFVEPVIVDPVIPFEQRRRRLPASFAAAAAVAVALLGWMQFGVVEPLRSAVAEAREPYTPKTYPLENLRGTRIEVANSTSGAQLDVDTSAVAGHPGPYTCRIVDAQNRPHGAAFTSSADDQKIVIPPKGLKPGDYTIRVSDANQKVVTEYPIAVR